MTDTSINETDQQHLKLLSIFHYVVGGICYVFGFFPIFHLFMGTLMVSGAMGSEQGNDAAALRIIGCFFILFPLVFMLCTWTLATLIIVTAKKLASRLSYNFCLVIAAIECIFMPFGTVLGGFTIILLVKPEVKALFDDGALAPDAAVV